MTELEVEINELLGIDLLTNVFTKLSAMSVGRCRCVCKSWYRSLTDSVFTNHLHLKNQPLKVCVGFTDNNPRRVGFYRFIDTYNYSGNQRFEYQFDRKGTEKKLPQLMFTTPTYAVPIGSCNGLICVQYNIESHFKMHLWNPVTGEFKIVPLINPNQPHPVLARVLAAFGYDHHNHDYKILLFMILLNKVYVYSLRTNSWTLLSESLNLRNQSCEYCVLNGCIYIPVTSYVSFPVRKSTYILEFRLRDNSFQELPLPPDMASHDDVLRNYYSLKNIGGQLTTVQFSNISRLLHLWRFEEEKCEWLKWTTISPACYERGFSQCSFMKLICCNPDGKLVIKLCYSELHMLVLCDPKIPNSVLQDFYFGGAYSYYASDIGNLTYIETLVSPHLFDK